MLKGMMMDRPLSIPSVIEYAAEVNATNRIVSATVEGGIHSYSYAEARDRIAQLAHGLRAMGMQPGDRIATLAWNGYRHFELYYGISGIGAVCHTINPRLHPEQIAYITNHAEDRVLFFDLTFLPLVRGLMAHLPKGLVPVVMTDRSHLPPDHGVDGLICYEDILSGQPAQIDWPELDENTASCLCYTSGTTGEPKGALYSHRSTLLHSFGAVLAGTRSFGQGKRILPVVPLFHVNAWGLPYSAPLSGTDLVFPGPGLDGPSLFRLMDEQAVTGAWGVPTVWGGLLAEMRAQGRKPAALDMLLIGGSAVAPAMIRAFDAEFGISVLHGWGMTEMSPLGTITREPADMDQLPLEKRVAIRSPQGKRAWGVEMKIVDEAGQRQPHDGQATGELLVRGPFIVRGYYNNEKASADALDSEGWFRTGDVAKIDPGGDLTIVDRTKDLIKSGGEWISSIDVENIAVAHPGVALAAAIGLPHPKWDERPILVVVRAEGAEIGKEALRDHLAEHLAKWQVPDDVIFVESLPMTATGKVSKLELRKQFTDYRFADS